MIERLEYPQLVEEYGYDRRTYLLNVEVVNHEMGQRNAEGNLATIENPEVLTTLVQILEETVVYSVASKRGNSSSVCLDWDTAIKGAELLLAERDKRVARMNRRRAQQQRIDTVIRPVKAILNEARGVLERVLHITGYQSLRLEVNDHRTLDDGERYSILYEERKHAFEGNPERVEKGVYWRNLLPDRAREIAEELSHGVIPEVREEERDWDYSLYPEV